MSYDSKHTELVDPQTGYNRVARQYKEYHKHLDTFYKIDFHRFLSRDQKAFKLLDLGAGDGRMFQQLNALPLQTYVVCDIAKDLLQKHPRGPKHVICDLEKTLPFEDESFDISTCFFVLEHIHNLSGFLSEVYRILTPGGKLFIGHFFQRREFERSVKGEHFRIRQYKYKTEDILHEAKNQRFETEFLPLYDKKDYTGDLIICEKPSI